MKTKLERFINKFTHEKQKGDLHITRMFGALVAVSLGKVIGVDGPCLTVLPTRLSSL